MTVAATSLWVYCIPMDIITAIIAKTNEILDREGIDTDRERVETILTNFHADASTVTVAAVKAAVRRVSRTIGAA